MTRGPIPGADSENITILRRRYSYRSMPRALFTGMVPRVVKWSTLPNLNRVSSAPTR